MIKYWLKLWSVNENLFDDAIKVIKDWYFNFIELYIIPNNLNVDSLRKLKESWIELSVHFPHSVHWFNPIDPDNASEDIWDFLKNYIDYLDPFAIVMHPEIGSNIDVFEKRIKIFNDKRIKVENMPMKSSIWKDTYFYGYNLYEIEKIKKIHNNFCFDFAKAKSSAISQWMNIVDLSDQLIEIMNPNYFHISWFLWDTEVDEHFDISEWDPILMQYMKNKLINVALKKDIFVVFECKKKDWLKNDLKNLDWFKTIN